MSVSLADLILPVVCFIICSIVLILDLKVNYDYNNLRSLKKSIFPIVCWIIVTTLFFIQVAFYIVGRLQ